MSSKLDKFNRKVIKESGRKIPDIKPGYTIRVHQRIIEAGKERLQPFEGLVIAVKHGKGLNGTFTVRKIASGVGVERVYPLFSPNVAKIDIIKKSKIRRAKLYYMRTRFGRSARMKSLEVPGQETIILEEEKPKDKPEDEKAESEKKEAASTENKENNEGEKKKKFSGLLYHPSHLTDQF